jgi:hypothetical protein
MCVVSAPHGVEECSPALHWEPPVAARHALGFRAGVPAGGCSIYIVLAFSAAVLYWFSSSCWVRSIGVCWIRLVR